MLLLYKRSSFIKWLTAKGCEVYPLKHTNVMMIEGPFCTVKMWINPKDVIDYEEIVLICQKLHLQDLPGNKDLVIVE